LGTVIVFPDKELPKETTVVGTRREAEIAASSIIDAWLKKRVRENYCKFPNFLHRRTNKEAPGSTAPGAAELFAAT
jgi:hypothetical protein